MKVIIEFDDLASARKALELIDPAPAETAPPKPARGRKAAAATSTVESSAPTPSAPVAAAPAAATTADPPAAAPPSTGDIFGDAPAAAAPPAAAATQPEKAAPAAGGKELTVEDVRAKLVLVQTKHKDRKPAVEILKKFTIGGATDIARLPKEKFAECIKACDADLAKT